MRSNNVGVMLTGHGGDTVLFASPGLIPTHLADSLFDGNLFVAFREVGRWKRGCSERGSYSYWMLRCFLEPAINHLRGRQIRGADRLVVPSWITRQYATAMDLVQRGARGLAYRCRAPGHQALWDDIWVTALAMATVPQQSLAYEFRHPLLYRPLVEFMCGIPWDQKLSPRSDRFLQRRALKGVLPEPVRLRTTKVVGSAALVEGLRRSRDWLAYLCDSPLMAERGIADAVEWKQAVQRASVGQTHGDKAFLAGVAVESWLKQLKEHQCSKNCRSVP
jgi:asparagine synthetase B (glutamine-hydrolysing)